MTFIRINDLPHDTTLELITRYCLVRPFTSSRGRLFIYVNHYLVL